MTPFADLTGLAGNALAIASACLLLPGVSRLPRAWRISLPGAVFVAAVIPVDGLPAAAYLRGAIGDLSIPSLLLLSFAVARNMRGQPVGGAAGAPSGRDAGSTGLLILIVLGAFALYPMALGWGSFDPYWLGYGDRWFLSGLLAVAFAALWLAPTVAFAIGLAVLAWAVDWYASPNLWDYLLDPLVTIYALGALAKRSLSRRS